MLQQKGLEKSGIPRLVDHGGRRRQLGKVRHELEEPDVESFAGRLPPLFVIETPSPGHIFGMLWRNESREYRTLGKPLADRQDHRSTRSIHGVAHGPSEE